MKNVISVWTLLVFGMFGTFGVLESLALSKSMFEPTENLAAVSEKATYELSGLRKRTSWFIDSGTAEVVVEENGDGTGYIATFQFDFESSFSIIPSTGTMRMDVPAEYFQDDFIDTQLADGEIFESEAFKAKLVEDSSGKKHLCQGLEDCVLFKVYDINADFDLGGDDAEVQSLSFVASRVEGLPALKIRSFDLSGKISGLAIRVGGDIVTAE